MTADELERFLKSQAKMSARIAQKAGRARAIAQAYSAQGGSRSVNFARKVIQSLTRPGVAPGQRPKSARGGETFHFDVTTVNRLSDFTRAQSGKRQGAGAAHESYIERAGAAERLGDEFARTKAEMLGETWSALGGQSYIERPEAAEEVEGYRLASFGNIAATYDDRIAFWEAMERAASRPRSHGIATQRGNDPAFWAKVDADPDAPQILKNAPPFVPLPDKDPTSDNNTPRVVPVPRLADEGSLDVLDFFRKHRSPTKPARRNATNPVAVDFDPGRGGRIQTRLIVELPHELTPAQRLKLAQDYCHKEFVQGRDQPLPHWCVIHAPDHHNDPRNVHMHIVFAERPCKRMTHPETGKECWDFEVQIKVRDENKHNRLCRPFEQKTDREVNSAHWVKKARQDFATMANQALTAAGKKKIYDPRTYAAMGIGEKARERINGKDYLKEKRGESTEAGDKVIAAQWEREEARLARRFATFGPSRKYLDSFDVEIARWRHSPSAVAGRLMIHKHEYSVSVSLMKVLKAERAANAFVLAKIQSKILPPLQAKDEDALEAQDFLRMFKQDIVLRHTVSIEMNRRGMDRALTALARAQKAIPRETEGTGFLTGGPDMPAIQMPAALGRAFRRHETMQEAFGEWRAAVEEDIAERREMRKAIVEQLAARNGEVIYRADPAKDKAFRAEKAAFAAARTEPEPTPPRSTAAVSVEILAEAARILEAKRRAPGVDPAGRPAIFDGIPTQHTTTGERVDITKPLDPDDKYAENLRTISEFLNETMPRIVDAARTELPEDKKTYGDEIAIAFMSESGDPIQRRVYSPTRIRTADEQAAAVAAAIARRRAERIARNDAEVAALRVDPTKIPPRPQPSTPTARSPSTASPAHPSATAPSPPPAAQAPYLDPRSTGPSVAERAADPRIPEPQKAGPTTAERAGPSRSVAEHPQQTQAAAAPAPAPSDDKAKAARPGTPKTPEGPSSPAAAAPSPQPPSKKRVLTAEELRRRALLAAKSRGRGR